MSSPVRSGKVTVIHDAAPVAKLIDDVRTGISHLKVLEAVPSGVGQMRATVWPGERPIADGPEVTLRDVAGQAWLAARIREEQPDVVFIPEQVMRMASPASWPDHEALADIVSALEPVAAETGAAVVIAHPPATPLPTAPKKAKASRRIATGIERGKVTRFEAGADVATLVTAL
ncbi:MAG TPA: hypothetical protein VN213_07625, partial [Solirubrobacteraceae bacterium]|nr:hypothetical protein [Solirubrobacteraceae bacterium]